MDAFFASVEQRDDASLRGRPVAVGGGEARGVVAAASYEARAFGVRSAMPGAKARQLCPDLVFVKPRFDQYRAVSQQIHAIFAQYTALIQPLSLDEAYLDVTEAAAEHGSATAIARAIRAAIATDTGLTASAGVSFNKFLAKLASDQNKPNGLCVIRPEQAADFVAALAIERFHGIGPATAARLHRRGIRTGADLRAIDRDTMAAWFGKSADYYFNAARGVDHRPVNPDRTRKSIGAETTFFPDLSTLAACHDAIAPYVAKVTDLCARKQLVARTWTIKVRFADFRTITRSRTLPVPTADTAIVAPVIHALLDGIAPLAKGVRLLGVTAHNLEPLADATAPAPTQVAMDLPVVET